MNAPLKPRVLTVFLKAAIVAIPVGLLTVGAGLLAGCGKSVGASPTPRPAMKVNVVKVEPSNVPLTDEWVGTLDGYVNAQIQPQANGYLIRQDYREGAQVEKGQVLFEIDPRPFEAALEQAQGQLGQAQAERFGLRNAGLKAADDHLGRAVIEEMVHAGHALEMHRVAGVGLGDQALGQFDGGEVVGVAVQHVHRH